MTTVYYRHYFCCLNFQKLDSGRLFPLLLCSLNMVYWFFSFFLLYSGTSYHRLALYFPYFRTGIIQFPRTSGSSLDNGI